MDEATDSQLCLSNVQVFALLAASKHPVCLRVLDIAFVNLSRGLRISSLLYTNKAGYLMAKRCSRSSGFSDLLRLFAQDVLSNKNQSATSLPDV